MASKVMKYTTDLGEVFGVNVDDALYSALNVSGSSLDDEAPDLRVEMYADLAAFNTANDDAGLLPARIQPRSITISHPMGSANIILPTPFVEGELSALEGQTAFGDDLIDITRIQGEAQNNPDIVEVA